MGQLYGVNTHVGVTRKADTHHHIAGADVDHLLIDLTGRRVLHIDHVFEQQVEIEVQITRQKRTGAHTQNVNMLGVQQQLHRPLKFSAVDLFDGGLDAVHIPLHHRSQNIVSGDLIL